MEEMKQKIIEFAISNGYDYALYAGDWNEYDVYEPIFWDDEIHYIGKPHSILVTNKEIRLTTDEECFEVLDAIYHDECILENEPIKLDPNLTIKSFKFVRGGYPDVPDIYEYKSTKKNGKVLYYNNRNLKDIDSIDIHFPTEDISITVKAPFKIKIMDEHFDKYALEMIKYFHEDLGTNPNVCDGEWYEFSATLSNGQKLKSTGYNYFPFTYYKFVAYLGHYWK